MATAQKLTDHFLTCTICQEVLNDPCTLACGHSFCGQCIFNFTKTETDAIKSKSIPCPFCRRLTSVPDPSRPVEEWAEQRAPLLLKGLLDTVGPGSKDTTNCSLCHDEGEITPAVSWCPVCDVSLCTSCCKAHRRNPASRHHDVSDLTDEGKYRKKRQVKCREHIGELVKFFCRDCQETLCQTCCILNHRKCESVMTLESMLPEMRSSLEMKKETLMEKSRCEEKQLESLKSRCNDLDENKSSIQSQIQCTTQRVFEAAKKKEKELLDELNRVTDEHMDQLKADIKSRDMARDIYRQQSEFIEQALNSESETDIYELYKSSESETEESIADVKKGRTRTKIEFSLNMNRLESSLIDLSLGEIQVLDEVDHDTVFTPVPTLGVGRAISEESLGLVEGNDEDDQDTVFTPVPTLGVGRAISEESLGLVEGNDEDDQDTVFTHVPTLGVGRAISEESLGLVEVNDEDDQDTVFRPVPTPRVGRAISGESQGLVEVNDEDYHNTVFRPVPTPRVGRAISGESQGLVEVNDEDYHNTVFRPVPTPGVGRAISEESLGLVEGNNNILSYIYDSRITEDRYAPIFSDIKSIDWEGIDAIVVTDYSNECIKLFYEISNQRYYSRLKMSRRPNKIAKMEEEKIVVTFLDYEEISVVSVSLNLTLESTILTQKKYCSVTALTPTTLAAASDFPPCVDIIDINGNMIHSISPIHDGEYVIKKPFFLSTTRQGNIVISDLGKKSVLGMTIMGEVLFTYSPTETIEQLEPGGVAVTATGHILVVDYDREKVIQLNEAGEFVRDILTAQEGIYGPCGVDVDERGRIFVTCCSEEGGAIVKGFLNPYGDF